MEISLILAKSLQPIIDLLQVSNIYMLYPDSVFVLLRPLNFIRDNIRSTVDPCQHCICLGIIGKLFVISHKLQHTAKTIRDIGQVRKCS